MTKKKDTRNDMIEKSSRLRYTLELAKICQFDYPELEKNKYGGVFNVYQLEKILQKIRKLEGDIKLLKMKEELWKKNK